MLIFEHLVVKVLSVVIVVGVALVRVASLLFLLGAAAFDNLDLHLLEARARVLLELALDDPLHGKDKLDRVLVHLRATKHRAGRDDFVDEVTRFVEEHPWDVLVHVVLNALGCLHLDELDKWVLLRDLVQDLD